MSKQGTLRRRRGGLAVGASFLLVLLAACGGSNSGDTTTTSSAPRVETTTEAAPATPEPQATTTVALPQALQDLVDRVNDHSVPRATTQGAAPSSGTEGSQLQALSDFVNVVAGDADKMWAEVMAKAGLKEQMFYSHLVKGTESFQSQCVDSTGATTTVTADTNNAYYCSADDYTDPTTGVTYTGTVWLPVNTMLQMWQGDIFNKQVKKAGDFSAAILIVHEIGHEMVTELSDQMGVTKPTGMYTELLPDCFAGVWLAHRYYTGALSRDSYDQAIEALEVSGDYAYTAPDHHGTPAERRAALERGYNTASAASCVDSYWLTA